MPNTLLVLQARAMAPKKAGPAKKPRGKASSKAMCPEEKKERARALRDANVEHTNNLARVRRNADFQCLAPPPTHMHSRSL